MMLNPLPRPGQLLCAPHGMHGTYCITDVNDDRQLRSILVDQGDLVVLISLRRMIMTEYKSYYLVVLVATGEKVTLCVSETALRTFWKPFQP